MNINITLVGINEVNTLQKISIATFNQAFEHQNTKADIALHAQKSYAIEKLLHEINNAESQFYFLYAENNLAGYLKINWGKAQTENKFANSLEVERIYLLNPYQGKGLGKQFIEFAISQALQKKLDIIWLGVWEHNTNAIAFYKKLGFNPFSTHIYVVGTDPQTDILMSKTIKA
jgi:diamine N-acetyltransferase